MGAFRSRLRCSHGCGFGVTHSGSARAETHGDVSTKLACDYDVSSAALGPANSQRSCSALSRSITAIGPPQHGQPPPCRLRFADSLEALSSAAPWRTAV
jgi:hypothetical protein